MEIELKTAYCGYPLGQLIIHGKDWIYCCELHERQEKELNGDIKLPTLHFMWKYGYIPEWSEL